MGQRFRAPDGQAELEVLGGEGTGGTSRSAVLLLVHGSYHAAWCWDSHLLAFFRSKGYHTYALSLRGHGGSTVLGGRGAFTGTLELHAADVADVVKQLSKAHALPVVALGHSFGGLIVQQAVADLANASSEALAGMVLLASVPPGGNSSQVMRQLWRSPIRAVQITWGFVTRAFERDAALCRRLFFDPDMPLTEVEGYMLKMKEGCPPGSRLLDLRELQSSLPVPTGGLDDLPKLVLGGNQDAIVDTEALAETAAAHKVEALVLNGVAHDAMLGPKWRCVADAILSWMEQLEPCGLGKE